MSLKRTISLILVLCLCAALVPVPARATNAAEGGELPVNNSSWLNTLEAYIKYGAVSFAGYSYEQCLEFMTKEVYDKQVIAVGLWDEEGIEILDCAYAISQVEETADNTVLHVEKTYIVLRNDMKEEMSATHKIVMTCVDNDNWKIVEDVELTASPDIQNVQVQQTPAIGLNSYSTGYPNTWVNTGDQAVDIAQIALTQVGYTETSNHTKYNEWYYDSDTAAAWCAIFISWCADQAGVSTSVVKKNAVASGYTVATMNSNSFGAPAHAFGSVTPRSGDIAYINNDSDSASDHVGLVYAVDENYIYTVEGNYSDKVSTVKYSRASGTASGMSIMFFARPNYENTASASIDVGTNFYAHIINTSTWMLLTNDRNNVSARSGTDAADQVWYFERQGDGSYKITSVLDGNCMEVHNFGTTDGTNVQTLTYEGNSAQQWYISGTSGAYVFRAKCADTVLDVYENSTEEGTNVQMWTPNGTDAQLFTIWKLDDYTTGHPSAKNYTDVGTNFYAHIINTSTWSLVTNDRNNVSARSGTDAADQVWYFERQGDGSYKITSVLDGNCMEVHNFGTTDGTNVQTFPYEGNAAQQWYISGTSGAYVFRAKCAYTVLDVDNNSAEEGTNVQMWTPNGTDAQLFTIWKLDDYTTGHPSAKNYTDVGTNFYAHIINTSTWSLVTNDRNNVSARSGTDAADQVWYFERQGDGSYKITSVLDGNCMEVHNFGTTDGTNVQTFPYEGNAAQQWYISGTSGAYVFRAKCAYTVLDVDNNSAEEGTNVQMWTPNGTDAQLFTIWKREDYDTEVPPCPNITFSASQHEMLDGNFSMNDTVTVSWMADNADSYWLKITNNQDGSYIVNEGTTSTSYTFHPPVEGSYTVAMRAYNEAGDSGRIEKTIYVRSIVGDTWVSDSLMGDEKTGFPEGTTIFLHYELFDPNTHDLLYTFSTMDTYVTLSIIDPSGAVIHTQTFNNDDTDYISCVCTEPGTYTAQVDLWGNVYQSQFTVETYVKQVASGWSGATTWVLTSDGVLTFSGSGNMKNYGYNGGQPWAAYADQITSVVVEDGVAAVGSGAFMNLTNLESVTLPQSGLTKIGEAAFYGCTSLKTIDIPDTVYTVFDYTFKNCTALEEIRFSKILIKIGQGAFENCAALTYVYIPGNTGIIGAWSFKACTGLTEVDMTWADATEIRAGAFKNCAALTTIQLPGNIQTLGDSCFYGIGAESFTVPETVTTVEAWCFARASLTEIIFEGDAPTIGEGAFNKITLTAYYPGDNATWTAENMLNYGGSVAWKEK